MFRKSYIIAAMVAASISISACGQNQSNAVAETPVEVASEAPTVEEISEPTEEIEVTEASTEEAPTEEVFTEEPTEAEVSTEVKEEEPVQEELPYTLESMDETTMYANTSANVRSGPATSYDNVKQLSKSEEVTVIGKAYMKDDPDSIWYSLKNEADAEMFISAKLLSSEAPKVTAAKQSTTEKPASAASSSKPQQQPAPSVAQVPAPAPVQAPQEEYYYEDEVWEDDGWGGNVVNLEGEYLPGNIE